MRFTKMHGLGNDYVYLDCWDEAVDGDLPALARRLSDRRRGIGGDGLILVGPAEDAAADARMRMFNADGSESEMCGNGLRCAAKLAYDHGRIGNRGLRFQTGAGILLVDLAIDGRGRCVGATVDMGAPRLRPAEVPVLCEASGPRLELHLTAGDQELRLLAVGMGNPHAVCFVDDVAAVDLPLLGPILEHHPVFPRRSNIEFVERLADEAGLPVLRQRTWERGSGETAACGTGACAACVAAILDGRITSRETLVRLDGGDLHIAWPGNNASVIMSGPAVEVFRGDWVDSAE